MFEDEMKLWYRKPAQEWVEALPVGNGRLGAMAMLRLPTRCFRVRLM